MLFELDRGVDVWDLGIPYLSQFVELGLAELSICQTRVEWFVSDPNDADKTTQRYTVYTMYIS